MVGLRHLCIMLSTCPVRPQTSLVEVAVKAADVVGVAVAVVSHPDLQELCSNMQMKAEGYGYKMHHSLIKKLLYWAKRDTTKWKTPRPRLHSCTLLCNLKANSRCSSIVETTELYLTLQVHTPLKYCYVNHQRTEFVIRISIHCKSVNALLLAEQNIFTPSQKQGNAKATGNFKGAKRSASRGHPKLFI